jgi:REP element-mobilizing transposase RayT
MAPTYKPEFLTCAIHEWKHLLVDTEMKKVILNSFKWLVNEGRVIIYCFVIMPNHIHIVWRIADGVPREKVQGAFFSFTAHAFLKHLRKYNPELLMQFVVDKNDRKHQFWRRHALAKECFSSSFTKQKMEYIHLNPCMPKWKLAKVPEGYEFSSASFYHLEDDKYPWLTHIGNL